ncbi:MAG: energy transducer TonB [Chthoniobacterales bacterium]|nr:energy transducer TonB [Chthoniobacterales bacterium]
MFLCTTATSLFLVFSQLPASAGTSHPATVSQAAGSIAMQLHYPPKERAAQKQGAVKFYCELSPEGKASHITTLSGKGEGRFEAAVEFALRHGRFNPASVDGKPVSVMLGGTVVFLLTKGQPTIAITLATAEVDKVSAMTNYVQPQMIETDALFRRKIFALRDKYPLRFTRNPGAVVRVHVDAQGKMVSKKIESEAPPNGGYGRLLLDVADEEKFIPAQSNGQAVAGDFELVADFGHMRNPDGAPSTGTLLKNDGY